MTVPDGLRAFAALLVILPHSVGYFGIWPNPSAPTRLMVFLSTQGAGFRIFFVISGFVIAYSLRRTSLTLRSYGVYLVRRFIRITPPYWVALAMMLAFLAARSAFTHRTDLVPPPREVLANAFYLQDLLPCPGILGVAWTLCLEVQLYVAFCGLLCLMSYLTVLKGWPSVLSMPRVVWATWVVSIGWPAGLFPPLSGWFFGHWFAFAAGACVWWCVEGRLSKSAVGAGIGLMGLTLLRVGTVSVAAVTLAATILFLAGLFDGLTTWLSFRPLQKLAKVSYSLYLVHMPMIAVLMALQTRLGATHEWSSFAIFGLSYLVSLAVAVGFYLTIERPSLRLSKSLRRSHLEMFKRSSEPAAVAL